MPYFASLCKGCYCEFCDLNYCAAIMDGRTGPEDISLINELYESAMDIAIKSGSKEILERVNAQASIEN